VAVVVIIAGGILSVWSGEALSGARDLLSSADAQRQSDLLRQIAQGCVDDYKLSPTGTTKKRTSCESLLGAADTMPQEAKPGSGQLQWPDVSRLSDVLTKAAQCANDAGLAECAAIWRAALAIKYDDTFGF
jgi:hypothetical protein